MTLRGLAVGVMLFVVLVFGSAALGLFNLRFWSPRYEAARRSVFEQTPSYVHGKQQYLSRLHGEWRRASPSHRDALCATARHEASTLSPAHLTGPLAAWECVN
jgi:hypothetical protein